MSSMILPALSKRDMSNILHLVGLALLLCATDSCASPVFVSFSDDVAPLAEKFLLDLLQPFSPQVAPFNESLPPQSMLLAFGGSSSHCVGLFSLPSTKESFQIVKANSSEKQEIYCAAGVAPSSTLYAAFELLQLLGIKFFHPMQPLVPKALIESRRFESGKVYSPFWAVRGAHYHSEHPLDLCEFLHG